MKSSDEKLSDQELSAEGSDAQQQQHSPPIWLPLPSLANQPGISSCQGPSIGWPGKQNVHTQLEVSDLHSWPSPLSQLKQPGVLTYQWPIFGGPWDGRPMNAFLPRSEGPHVDVAPIEVRSL